MARIARVLAIAAPPVAVMTVLVAGALTPGYDASTRTISRLALPGLPGAAAVDVAMVLIALACIALATGASRAPTLGRVALVVAASAFIGTATVHLDPASIGATIGHRIFSGIAITGLTIGPLAFARGYGVTSLATGIAELIVLGIGLVLLTTSFTAWGIWERCLLAIPLAWMVLTAATSASTDATNNATTATLSSTTS